MFPQVWLVGVLAVSVQTPASVENAAIELKRRLVEYEARDEKSAVALRPTAQLTLDLAVHSSVFQVWLEACTSPFTPTGGVCQDKLWRTVKEEKTPLVDRVRAAAALVRRGDKDAATVLSQLLPRLTNRELGAIATVVALLPTSSAAPVLLRLLSSEETTDKIAACRALGHVDTAEVRAALRAVVAQSSPSLQPWNACQIARARLKEPESVNTISGYSRYLEGEDLLDAAGAMLDIGNEQGGFLLRKLTREAPTLIQLQAAERLAESDPAAAARVTDAKLNDADPRARAQALSVERRLRRLATGVRSRLLDEDELVRVRAAEAVLAWAREAH